MTNEEERRRRLKEIRRKKRRRRAIRNRIVFAAVLLLLLVGIVFGVKALVGGISQKETSSEAQGQNTETGADFSAFAPSAEETTAAPSETTSDILAEAERLAASYDYDRAISLLQSSPGYENDSQMTAAIQKWETEKGSLQAVDISTIPHVFFHSLIADPSKAFYNDAKRAEDYNQVMTTVDEFNKIIQQMYDRGYVLVKIHDMAINANGMMEKGKIMLPPDKKPFVLSIDDVSYYEYMQGDGYASRIVIDSDGYPTCEMDMEDGSVQTGGFDVVPLLESFIKEHPDFSYRGARGIIALTGYDGILGYRTAPKYGNPENPDYKPEYAQIDWEQEKARATSVAARMEELGWEFASHSWGHKDMRAASLENMENDMQKWLDQVNPLLGGDTDILIFPFGTDIGSWRNYDDNEKFDYLKSVGFDYYCNVDANQPWVQFSSQYLRQARINFDGYEMYYCADKLTQFFDVDSVFDSSRPTPVKPLG